MGATGHDAELVRLRSATFRRGMRLLRMRDLAARDEDMKMVKVEGGPVEVALVDAAWSRGQGAVINSQGIMPLSVVRAHTGF